MHLQLSKAELESISPIPRRGVHGTWYNKSDIQDLSGRINAEWPIIELGKDELAAEDGEQVSWLEAMKRFTVSSSPRL